MSAAADNVLTQAETEHDERHGDSIYAACVGFDPVLLDQQCSGAVCFVQDRVFTN